VQENSESVGGRLFETWVDYSKESYSSQIGVDDGGGNGRSCFEVEVRMDANKVTNVIIAGLRVEI